jgi:hypothetical protein
MALNAQSPLQLVCSQMMIMAYSEWQLYGGHASATVAATSAVSIVCALRAACMGHAQRSQF